MVVEGETGWRSAIPVFKWTSCLIWNTDLVFESKWPVSKLDLDISMANILVELQKDLITIVTIRMLTCFSLIVSTDIELDPTLPTFGLDPNNLQEKHFDQSFERLS